MSKILVAGDCHGQWYDLQCVIAQAIRKYNIDKVIQVGDFGYYPGVFEKNKNFKFQVPVYAIMGNHEDHKWIVKQSYTQWEKDHNIFLIQQGDTWIEDNSKFGFLGKAFNVDRKQEGKIKLGNTNFITKIECDKAIEKFNALGKLDFLITHSCPHSIGVGMQGLPIFFESIYKYIEKPFKVSTGPIHDCGEPELTNLWNGLIQKPSEWIFGHWHKHYQKQVQDTVFTCVGAVDSYKGNEFTIPYIIDTVKKTFEAFPKDVLFNSNGLHKTYPLEKNDYPI